MCPEESQTKGERSRQAVMEAAYELFLEQGFAASSMRQVAERAGLALGGIYNHFPGKEAIFAELIIERHPFRQVLPALLDTGDDLEQFVRSAQTRSASWQAPGFHQAHVHRIVEFNGQYAAILEQVLPGADRCLMGIARPMPIL
jgi:AcrR family transcriptional regulator